MRASVPIEKFVPFRSGLLNNSRENDELVDALAQILEHEILLGGRAALVDLLRPLFERHLDAERLVDREGDVEEVEAVDSKVVDRVTFGLDLVARDVARLRNDIGDRIERC
jgi:hypothetical protein